MERADKDTEIQSLSESFEKSPIALCADYRGLTVEEITVLRRTLREAHCFGKVVKNTLARISATRVLSDSDPKEVARFVDLFKGPSLLVFSEDDAVAPAKILANFAKDHNALEIKGGWLDGSCLDQEGVSQLSSLPSKEELQAKLLSLIQAPATQLVGVLSAPAGQLVRVVEARRKQLEEAA